MSEKGVFPDWWAGRGNIILGGLVVLALTCAPLRAQGLKDVVVASMVNDGFTDISISRTLLGRIRIVAVRDGRMREVVLNPSTQNILRDYSKQLDRQVYVAPDDNREDIQRPDRPPPPPADHRDAPERPPRHKDDPRGETSGRPPPPPAD